MKCEFYVYCLTGLSLALTYDNLSNNKNAYQSTTPTGVNMPNYVASRAVDGDQATCMRTETIGLSSPEKAVWWKVDLGGVFNIFSVNILFKTQDEMIQRGRFAGFSLFVSNTDVSGVDGIKRSTLCYKDGPELPPLNFTTICTNYGKFVIFYNERQLGETYPSNYQIKNVFTELCEVTVHGCHDNGVYGVSCDNQCPKNCKDNICHIQDGFCFGCEPGWMGTNCQLKCKEKWYGENCSQPCSRHCKDGNTCNYVTGQCDGGCEAGWAGFLCEKECINGTYGENCTQRCSGNCLKNLPCNKQTGICNDGCIPGYTNKNCSSECSFGLYGIDCMERCSEHCKYNEPCDHVNGVCPKGCQDGYIGNQCDKSCKKGYYGTNCSLECSPKCQPNTCKNTDGGCTCISGWSGNNCTSECYMSYGENCQYPCNKYCINQTCNRFNGSCPHICKDDNQCDIVSPNHIYSSDGLSSLVGGTVGVFVFVILGTVIILLVLRRKRQAKMTDKRESILLQTKPSLRKATSEHLISQNYRLSGKQSNAAIQPLYALPEKTKKGPPTNKNISVRNMTAQITNMSVNENMGFKSEYHDIPRGELHPCVEGKKQENKVKNRYTTIFPYDHSRVVLKTVPTDGGEYINANFIEDTRGRRTYIATQGPKPKTIADFWTMIWQEEVCNIVCLTNLTEGTKNKCAQYWPDINDKLQGGTLTVRHLEEKTYAEYIIRKFKIHNKSTRSDRQVTMFHYVTWSDHGVADPLSLVVFHRHVIRATANSTGKYTVVHCSAGVGRTGTYIALDALYREGERTGKINVPMYVRTMRKDRMNMIQGDDQYKLLYLALKDAFYGQKKCLETEKFLGEYQERTCYTNCGDISQKASLSSDHEELLSLRKEYTQHDYISGRAQISANYTESVLPVEEFMCHLYYMKGYNTYYNAVFIQSYLEKDSLISAQYPLPDNTEDFLRLVKDFDASVVVFLCPLEDIESTSKWFPPENQHKFNGIFYVKNMSSTRSHNVKLTRLNIQPTGYSEMDITLLECPTWGERLKKGDKRVLLDVIKAVKTEKSDQKGRVLVLSRDGATRCGPFLAVYNVLEQISVDREVDIFTAVRQIQIRRPECVSTVDEYKLCHDAVAEYLLNDCVYGNC